MTPLAEVECLVSPERRLILVCGDAPQDTGFVPDFGTGRLCYPDRDVLYLVSVSDYHDASVTLQTWDAEPPPDPAAEHSEAVEVELSRGGAFVSALLSPRVSPVLRVGPPGRYHVRVDVTGREAVRLRLVDLDDRPSGVERFVVAFWPTGG